MMILDMSVQIQYITQDQMAKGLLYLEHCFKILSLGKHEYWAGGCKDSVPNNTAEFWVFLWIEHVVLELHTEEKSQGQRYE